MGIAGLLCAYRSVKESCEKMSVDMTFSFLNKEYEDDQEKVVDVVNDHEEKVEEAEVERKEEEYNPSENYREQYYEGTEKDDAFDDIRSDEEEEEEDETDALQFGKRAFSDIYSPVGELDQDKSEEPVMKKQKFEISEILSSAV